ncbi:hypothetical protein K501DRAFT_258034 [Backusella circina FSU 941]|nr:hypothetical protein K501DRAFT_258034 [Backusella circina FSU 941]
METEIVISFSDEEDNIGPSLPPSSKAKQPESAEIAISEDDLEDNSTENNIGPQIPLHLLQKKKEQQKEQEEDPSSIGPVIPAHLLKKRQQEEQDPSSIGPVIPPHLLKTKQQPQEEEEEEEEEEEIDPDAFAPALPPDLIRERAEPPTSAAPTTGRRRRPVGPTMPTGPLPPQYDDDDDYMVGPALPTNYNPEEDAKYSAIHAIEERARLSREAMEKKESGDSSGKVERPEWMIVPPEVDYLKKADSSRSRTFNSSSLSTLERDSTIWTETPAEKQKRLQEESLGKRKAPMEEPGFSEKDYAMKQKVDTYNMDSRPLSLLEMHQQKKKKAKEMPEDVTKRAFDREKDLLNYKKVDKKSKKEFLKRSGEFNTKFGYGKSSFL